MEEIVVAGLVGAGLGYLVRLGQEQLPRVVRGLARNRVVAGSARRGRDVLQAGAKGGMQVAQAGAKGGMQVAQAGAKGGMQVAQAGAKGGMQVARAAVGRAPGAVRPSATGRPAQARAVRVPVGEGARAPRRTSTRTSGRPPVPKRETGRRGQSTDEPGAAARSQARTRS
jgi:hypothetical protein